MRNRNGAAKRRKTRHAMGDDIPPHGPSSSRTGSPGAISRFGSSISRATSPPTSSAASPEPETTSCSQGTTVQVVIPPFFRDATQPQPPVRHQFEAVVIPQFFADPLQTNTRSMFLGVIIPRFFGPRSNAPSVRPKRDALSQQKNQGSSSDITWTPINGPRNLGYDEAVEHISIRHRVLANFRILYGELNRGQHDLADQFDLICGHSSEWDHKGDLTPWISTEALVLFLQKAMTTIMTAVDDPTFTIRQTLTEACDQLCDLTAQNGEEDPLDCAALWTVLCDTSQALPKSLRDHLPLSLPRSFEGDVNEDEIMGDTEPRYTAQFIPVVEGLLQAAIDAHFSSSHRKRQDNLGRPPTQEAKKPESSRVQPKRKVTSKVVKSKQTTSRIKPPRVDPDKKMAEAVMSLSVLAKDPEPLGTDPNGRIYWTCCPGPLEWQHAEMILHPPVAEDDKAKEAILRRKRRIIQSFSTKDERSDMQRWSWILAVWGVPPFEKGAKSSRRKGKSRAQERWSGFYCSSDIRELAAWLEEAYQDRDDDGNVQILADRIRHFSKVLEYRCKIADSI